MTPDYNDGKWHGWNGGECPVHPESEMEFRNTHGHHEKGRLAGRTAWDDPLLFRVTKAYVEPPKPREFWLYRDNGQDFDVLPQEPELEWDEVIHVIEVLK